MDYVAIKSDSNDSSCEFWLWRYQAAMGQTICPLQEDSR